jgi:hypothetical protein
MLAYLEDLCTALLAHDAVAVHRLLAHPLARSLPRQVREEALAISRAHPSSLRAPIQTLRFYHQSLQLGEVSPDAHSSEVAGDDPEESHADSAVDPKQVASESSSPSEAQPRPQPPSGSALARHVVTPTGTGSPPREARDQMELPFDCARGLAAVAA